MGLAGSLSPPGGRQVLHLSANVPREGMSVRASCLPIHSIQGPRTFPENVEPCWLKSLPLGLPGRLRLFTQKLDARAGTQASAQCHGGKSFLKS